MVLSLNSDGANPVAAGQAKREHPRNWLCQAAGCAPLRGDSATRSEQETGVVGYGRDMRQVVGSSATSGAMSLMTRKP